MTAGRAQVGGEEFALLVTVKDEMEARTLATQLLHQVEVLGIPHVHSGGNAVLTVSLGGRLIRPAEADLTLEQAYREVDQLLYRAKREGRNRAVLNF